MVDIRWNKFQFFTSYIYFDEKSTIESYSDITGSIPKEFNDKIGGAAFGLGAETTTRSIFKRNSYLNEIIDKIDFKTKISPEIQNNSELEKKSEFVGGFFLHIKNVTKHPNFALNSERITIKTGTSKHTFELFENCINKHYGSDKNFPQDINDDFGILLVGINNTILAILDIYRSFEIKTARKNTQLDKKLEYIKKLLAN